MKRIFLLFFTAIIVFSISCEREVFDSDNSQPSNPNNDTTLLSSPYPFGVAITMNQLKTNAKYRDIIIKEIQSITAENAMKMGNLSKGRNQYFWEDADYIVDFAEQYKKRVHGHALIWYKQSTNAMPEWVVNFQGNKDEWKQIMKEYIHTVVGRYKGRIESWDVVNEAIGDNGQFRPASECVWTRNIGVPEYIDWAFQCAHEADPDALLFYNDYGNEYSQARRTAVNNLIAGMKERGVPIHGIGMQMHTHINRPLPDIRLAINTALETGLKIHISELDIAVNPNNNANITFTQELSKLQAYHYKMIAKYMKDLPADRRHGITTWGVADPNSYKFNNPDWPLLFDLNYNKKPAYFAAIEGFNM